MTAAPLGAAGSAAPVGAQHSRLPGVRVTMPRVLASEWIKFRSLRSTYYTLLATVVLTVGLGALFAAVTAANWPHTSIQDRLTFDPVGTVLNGIFISDLAVGVLGVLLISGEYSTGMIRATLTAVPRRLPVLWGKLAVFAGVTAIASFASTFAAFFIGEELLSSQHIQTTIGAPGVLRMVCGGALYLVMVGIIGLALGALLRNTAAAISALVALFFVIPPILLALPKSWTKHIQPYLPADAGSALWSRPDAGTAHLAPWTGFGVMCLWAVAFVAGAAFCLARRDA